MEYVFSKNMANLEGSAIRALMSILKDPEIISLAGGNPSPATFPGELLAGYASELIGKQGGSILQYGPTEGYAPLIESCAARNRAKGIFGEGKQVLPVSGSSQAIDLAAKVMLNPGDVVLCESPTFLGALQTFQSYGAKTVGVESDEQGLVVSDLRQKMEIHKPKMLYVIPNFSNPTGKTWSQKRREEVLQAVGGAGILLLEDDPYGELCYGGGGEMPALASMDEEDCVLYLSSFSKTVSPGLRVGYATGHPVLLRKMTVAKQGSDVHTSNLSQAVVDRFLRSGEYEAHVGRTCEYYRIKLACMLEAIERFFPEGVAYTKPQGGLFVWVELPGDVDTEALLQQAVEQKVAFVPGISFFADKGRKNCLRLNFSMASEDKIREGCKRLGGLIAKAI